MAKTAKSVTAEPLGRLIKPRRSASGGKLTALAVTRATKRGMYNDGLGLYLQVAENGSKSWILRYTFNGRARHFGVGPTHTISLADARTRAADARKLILDGIDPINARRERKAAAFVEAAKNISFDDAAEEHIAALEKGWKTPRLAKQWRGTLKNHASPHFGKLPVAAIDTGMVMRALKPIWSEKPETAARVRMRIESILDAAKVKGYRTGENPARWAGHLEHVLSARPAVKHHPALPYTEIASFIRDLHAREATSARTMEFMILCASRSNEALGARWDEVDLAGKVWTVPAIRMKGRETVAREHRVPLCNRAVEIVEEMAANRRGEFIFPSFKATKHMSGTALLDLLKRMDRSDITPHGMRACFRTWAAHETNHPREIAEAALAHVVGGVEGAYQRGDLFEKRRRLMNDWARYCESTETGGNVVNLRGA